MKKLRKITPTHYYSEDFTSFKGGPTETQNLCLAYSILSVNTLAVVMPA